MAATNTNPNEAAPLADLNGEAVKHLKAIGVELDEAEKDIEALEAVGMDTSRLRERLDWGRKARSIILKRYGIEA